MSLVDRTVAFFRVPEGQPEIVTAKIKGLSKKTPMMYAVIIAAVIGLSFTHFAYAPIWLTVVIPVLFIILCLMRLFVYWRAAGHEPDEAEARRRLATTTKLSVVLSLAFVLWALGLAQYGTPQTHGQVIVFAGATMLSNAASLMHVRAAVISMLVGVIVPLSGYLVLTGDVVNIVTALNLVGVTIAVALVLLDSHRDFVRMIRSSVELEKQRAAAQALSRANFELATIDSLTGLQNRRGFLAVLEEKLKPDGAQTPIALGLLDLDGFKPVNDVYGHPSGDEVLKEVGRRLVLLGSGVIVARLGGDEFGLLFTGFADEADLMTRAEMVCERMRLPFRMSTFSAQMSGSIGLAVATAESRQSDELLKRADHALYHAKQNACGHAVLFNRALAKRINDSMQVERRLRDANLEREMSLAYQFVYDATRGGIVGAEALARWDNPMLGAIPPDVFIPAAERAGLIGQVTEILFRKLLAEFVAWPQTIFVSFNLSAHDLCAPERILRLITLADRKGIDPKRLTFEITETAVMHDFEGARSSLQLLKTFGAKIALDDFGTGHSSLSYVHRLPLDRVKVDRSFVADIERSSVTRAVVQTILDLCTHLDLDCIIEGVETEGQRRVLEELGCRTFQGFLFSHPLDGVTARRLLAAEQQQQSRSA